MNSLELRRKRAKLIADARAVVEPAEAEGRDLTAEEQQTYDAMWEKINEYRNRIDRIEAQEQAESELGDSQGTDRRGDPMGGGQPSVPTFESRGLQALDPGWQDAPEWRALMATTTPEYRRAFGGFLRDGTMEARAMQADVNTTGGYLIAPMQFVDELIKAVDNLVYMRQWARTFTVATADSLGAPSLENDPADPTWTSELAIGSEDSNMSLGRRALHPHPLAKYIKVSNTLLRKVPSAESLVRDRLAYKHAVTMENNYLNGDGAGKPLGVFTASADGIPASRDVSTGNTTTAMTVDGLINAKFSLKQQYWPNCRWLFHRDGVKEISKLKDGNGQYIWREGTRAGEPDRLLNVPVFMSEYAPSTFTTGLYVGIIGDFSHYWIADALGMQFQRLVELFAATNQVGIVGRLESDGLPVLSEAFARVTLA